MTTYAERLAETTKGLVLVYDFPAQLTRFCTRRIAGLSLPGGWRLFEGAVPLADSGNDLDVRSGSLSVGGGGFRIPDVDEQLTDWLRQHDGTLHQTRVSRLEGFEDVAESEWFTTRWSVDDVRADGRLGGGYRFELANALAGLARSLYGDFDQQSHRLGDGAYPTGLAAAATTITLDESPKGKWREPGRAVLWDESAKNVELVAYQTIGGSGNKDLQTVTRRKFGVGAAGHVFTEADCEVFQVWVKRGHPVDLMLEWLLTTAAAGASAPAELLVNGGLDTWTSGTDCANWTELTADGSTIAQETSIVKRGTSSLKLTTGLLNTLDGEYREDFSLTPGKWYALRLFIRRETDVGSPTFQAVVVLRNQTQGKFVGDAGTWVTGTGDTFQGEAAPGVWEERELIFQVDPTFAGGDTYRLTLRSRGGTGAGHVARFDAVQFRGPYDTAPASVYDAGDGDGLGLDPFFVDVERIEDVREELWDPPLFTGDVLTSGTANLFVEREPIRDVKEWIEAHVLEPYGLFPITSADERLAIEMHFRSPSTAPISIGSDWRVRDFNAQDWRRNFRSRINNLSFEMDWNPAGREADFNFPVKQDASIERYGDAKLEVIKARGARGGRLGFPDYGSETELREGANRLLLELANPFTPIRVRAFYRHKDLGLGSIISLIIPTIPNLRTGRRGADANDQWLVTRRRLIVDGERGEASVELGLHLRRPVLRPAFVTPDAASNDYATASAADRAFCYIAPDSDMFANGDEAYTIQFG